MNQRELNELRRRFHRDRSNISHVFGCYVNSNRSVISWIDAALGPMPQEEREMYLGLLKKSLSGALGRNLIDINFATRQVADSDEHRLLQVLRQSALQDREAREELCRRIIESIDMRERNYLILLAADAYDVPHKSRNDEFQPEASDQVFRYFVCAVCPVRDPELELCYCMEESEFHSRPTGRAVSAPELGFLFPAFDNRAANIYHALFYNRSAEQLHQEVIDALFRVVPPMSAAQQKNTFDAALGAALEEDCSYDVVQAVHEQLCARIEEHKESKDPQPLSLSIGEIGRILENGGAEPKRVVRFREECGRQFGNEAQLIPGNIIESKKFEVSTAEIRITVAPENSHLIETRVINGRKFILVPADGEVKVNGMDVTIPKE